MVDVEPLLGQIGFWGLSMVGGGSQQSRLSSPIIWLWQESHDWGNYFYQ